MTRIRQLIQQYGFVLFALMAVDSIICYINDILRLKLYHWTRDDFGFMEALFWARDISLYLRYSKIMAHLQDKISLNSVSQITVLEVGSGGPGISNFLKYCAFKNKCDLTLADTDYNALSRVKSEKTAVIHGDCLPFESNSFDVVISVDTLEHIPKDKRAKFITELKRVTKKTVLLHSIAHDPDMHFLARDADQKFQNWYIKKFGKPHRWAAEHLKIDSPTIQEINDVLPGALITGTQNINTWFDCITFCEKPLVGFFAGFMYIAKWKKKDNSPPFHSCFVKWIKSN